MIMDSVYVVAGVVPMSREAQTGSAAIPPAQRGEWFASGLRVRGRYRVVSEIGAGAFGTVCLGEDEATGHRVAIRFLPRNFARSPQTPQVLRIAASASHAAMARVLEFGELDTGQPFTVTEFVEGRRLSQMMSNRAPLDVHAALGIALELGGAVETLHNTGFVHGAVSPRNVVVLEDGRVKLLDIELAGLRDARELEGFIDADPPAEYLSPEQIQKAPLTEKTDIYGFGVILYELLSGVPPFQGSTRDAIFAKHLKDAPVPIHTRRDGVPASVSRAVTLALYKQPEARPLMGDIFKLLRTGARGPAPRKTRAVLIGGGAVLATLAVVAVIWGVLALGPNAGSLPAQPTALPTVVPLPANPPSAPPTAPTRRPLAPAVATPHDMGRAPANDLRPSVRAPVTSEVPVPKPGTPALSAPPVERALGSTRPPLMTAPSESRPTSAARVTPPAPAVTPPAPAVAPPALAVAPRAPAVTPPAPAVAPPAPPATAPSPAVTSPTRPAPPAPAQAIAPVTPRAERREQPQTPSAPSSAPARAPSAERDDSHAVIDWLLNPRSQ
jgi:eukaryotic-like serine/threonine-protein kinase